MVCVELDEDTPDGGRVVSVVLGHHNRHTAQLTPSQAADHAPAPPACRAPANPRDATSQDFRVLTTQAH
jgi:hypothetical protein